MYVYVYICKYVCIYMYGRVCIYLCICMYVYVCICVMLIYTYMYMYVVCICVCLCICVCMFIQSNTDNTNSFGLKKKFVLTVIWVIDIPLLSINVLVTSAKNLCARFQICILVTYDFLLMILTSSVDLEASF